MLSRGRPDEVWGAPHDGRRSGDVARFDSWQAYDLEVQLAPVDFLGCQKILYPQARRCRVVAEKIVTKIDLRDRLPHRQPAAARHVQRPREARVRDRSEEADAAASKSYRKTSAGRPAVVELPSPR